MPCRWRAPRWAGGPSSEPSFPPPCLPQKPWETFAPGPRGCRWGGKGNFLFVAVKAEVPRSQGKAVPGAGRAQPLCLHLHLPAASPGLPCGPGLLGPARSLWHRCPCPSPQGSSLVCPGWAPCPDPGLCLPPSQPQDGAGLGAMDCPGTQTTSPSSRPWDAQRVPGLGRVSGGVEAQRRSEQSRLWAQSRVFRAVSCCLTSSAAPERERCSPPGPGRRWHQGGPFLGCGSCGGPRPPGLKPAQGSVEQAGLRLVTSWDHLKQRAGPADTWPLHLEAASR